jgi:hypothetical protein
MQKSAHQHSSVPGRCRELCDLRIVECNNGISAEEPCFLCSLCPRITTGKIYESSLVITEAHGEFKNPDEEKHLPLEAVTRRMVKTMAEDTCVHIAMNYKV